MVPEPPIVPAEHSADPCPRCAALAASLARLEARLAWYDPRCAVTCDVGQLEFPLETTAEVNAHGAWRARHRRVKRQRGVVLALLRTRVAVRPLPAAAYAIRLTRIAPRRLDSDNLGTALKATQDEVAAWLGIDDGDERLHWFRGQLPARNPHEQLVRIEIATCAMEGP